MYSLFEISNILIADANHHNLNAHLGPVAGPNRSRKMLIHYLKQRANRSFLIILASVLKVVHKNMIM